MKAATTISAIMITMSLKKPHPGPLGVRDAHAISSVGETAGRQKLRMNGVDRKCGGFLEGRGEKARRCSRANAFEKKIVSKTWPYRKID